MCLCLCVCVCVCVIRLNEQLVLAAEHLNSEQQVPGAGAGPATGAVSLLAHMPVCIHSCLLHVLQRQGQQQAR